MLTTFKCLFVLAKKIVLNWYLKKNNENRLGRYLDNYIVGDQTTKVNKTTIVIKKPHISVRFCMCLVVYMCVFCCFVVVSLFIEN